jgi:hypothetical protein
MHQFSAAQRYVTATRDAKRERALAAGIPELEPVNARQNGELLISVNGQTIALELRPDRRDCRRWYAFKGGQPYEHGGLERIWRKIQSELVPLLGERNLL